MKPIIALIGILLIATVAAAETEKPLGNVKELAGTWSGYRTTGNREIISNITMIVHEDGSYISKAPWGMLVQGNIFISDGKLSFQSSLATGTVTYYTDKKGRDHLRFHSETAVGDTEYERK